MLYEFILWRGDHLEIWESGDAIRLPPPESKACHRMTRFAILALTIRLVLCIAKIHFEQARRNAGKAENLPVSNILRQARSRTSK
jgi:hypothetical protein